jgi:hypothetical protein
MNFMLGLVVGGLATWVWREPIRDTVAKVLDSVKEVGAGDDAVGDGGRTVIESNREEPGF